MIGESGVTIDREERDGLYELVRNHLGSIEDFWGALERTKNFAAVERRERSSPNTSGSCRTSAGASTRRLRPTC
jgi:hypothetical protein